MRGAAPDHAVQRRADDGRGGGDPADAHHRVGPGGRRRGRPGAGAADRAATSSSPSTWAAPPPRPRIIEDGEVGRATEYQVGGGIMLGSRLLTGAGYLLRVPAIDLAEVGAGGGSIVWLDAGGALQVGPRSAGASPGPLCYDLGGTEPTITDANVDPRLPQPGRAGRRRGQAQRRPRARGAARSGSPSRSGCRSPRRAYGAHLIAASNMMRAIRAVSSERGRDPREYALFAFGGNGPLFAAGMARRAGDDADRGPAGAGPLLVVRAALLGRRAPLRAHVAPPGARTGPGRAGRGLRARWRARRAPSSPQRASARPPSASRARPICATRASPSS